MPKLEIASAVSYRESELAAVVADFSTAPLRSHRLLLGGYSCANYRIDLADGSTFVLKITRDYPADHAERMCRTAAHLQSQGYSECCFAVPRIDDNDDPSYRYVSQRLGETVPAFLVTFSSGIPADRVLRERPDLAPGVMKGIGAGLARMHAAATGLSGPGARELGLRFYQVDGGCCDLDRHVWGEILQKIADCPAVVHHPFPPFYRTALAELQAEMQSAHASNGLELGIIHGDPFADNILVDPQSGELSSFIDVEDICVGPLLFDLACCAIGSTFDDSPDPEQQTLNLPLLEALLNGYCSARSLPPYERDHFVPFMRVALCCNCTWRFCKFNVTDGTDGDAIPIQAKNSYRELQRRIEVLRDPEMEQTIRTILQKY